jgi:hypothetical protein
MAAAAKRVRFHVDSGPASLFERVRQVFDGPVRLKVHGRHLAERTAGVDAPLAELDSFDPAAWQLMTVEARQDTGRFVTTAWRRKIDGTTWWVVIGYGNTVRTLFRKPNRGRGPEIVTEGPIFDLVDRVNAALVAETTLPGGEVPKERKGPSTQRASTKPSRPDKSKRGQAQRGKQLRTRAARSELKQYGADVQRSEALEGHRSLLSAISRGADPGRIVAQSQKHNGAAQTDSKRRRKAGKPKASSTQAAAVRIRNGEVDDLRSVADRRLGKGAKQKVQEKPAAKPRTCRECLKEKPATQFPSRFAICTSCGGRPPSRSIRTVSGGLPTMGRRR